MKIGDKVLLVNHENTSNKNRTMAEVMGSEVKPRGSGVNVSIRFEDGTVITTDPIDVMPLGQKVLMLEAASEGVNGPIKRGDIYIEVWERTDYFHVYAVDSSSKYTYLVRYPSLDEARRAGINNLTEPGLAEVTAKFYIAASRTALFRNLESVERAIRLMAETMGGGDDWQHIEAIERTLTGDGGAYGEPIYVRATKDTPLTKLSFKKAVELLGGEIVVGAPA